MIKPKTELQIEIEAAAGFYRAIGELDQVAACRGTEIQRKAFKACWDLQKILDAEIEAWNYESDDEHPRIVECQSQKSHTPWDARNECGLYTSTLIPSPFPQIVGAIGICDACALRKLAADTEFQAAA